MGSSPPCARRRSPRAGCAGRAPRCRPAPWPRQCPGPSAAAHTRSRSSGPPPASPMGNLFGGVSAREPTTVEDCDSTWQTDSEPEPEPEPEPEEPGPGGSEGPGREPVQAPESAEPPETPERAGGRPRASPAPDGDAEAEGAEQVRGRWGLGPRGGGLGGGGGTFPWRGTDRVSPVLRACVGSPAPPVSWPGA